MKGERVKTFTPYFWFIAGIIDIVIALHYLSEDPTGIKWIVYTLVGGGFVITGVAWHAEINKLSKKPVILLGVIFGMFLILLAIYRANFITHGYDLASNALFVLGVCITAVWAALFNKFK
jgi:hypothetical protein